jgi:hypothetical protein
MRYYSRVEAVRRCQAAEHVVDLVALGEADTPLALSEGTARSTWDANCRQAVVAGPMPWLGPNLLVHYRPVPIRRAFHAGNPNIPSSRADSIRTQHHERHLTPQRQQGAHNRDQSWTDAEG